MNNHKTFPCLLGLGLAAAMATVPSADAAKLTVAGSITPQGCTLSLDNDGEITLGEISLEDIHPLYGLNLAEKKIGASVRCPSRTAFGLHFSDSIREDKVTTTGFHLVSDNDPGKRLGMYQAFLSDGMADGSFARFYRRNNAGFLEGLSAIQSNDLGYAIVVSKPGYRAKDVTFSIRLKPSLAARNHFDASQDVSLAGQMTVELSYL